MASAGELRLISQAVNSVSQELAMLLDEVRIYLILYIRICTFC